MSRPEISRCRSCKAPILWATTANGKNMPVDAEPSPMGTVALRMEGATRHSTTYTLATRPPGGRYHVPHFVTCANAAQHRRAPA